MAESRRTLTRGRFLIGVEALFLFLLFVGASATDASRNDSDGQPYARPLQLTLTNTPTSTPVPVYCGPAVSFASAVNYTTGTRSISVAVGEFNSDGHPDLAVAKYDSSEAVVLLGNGDGTFASPLYYSVEATPRSLVLGDFNSDGYRILLRQTPEV